VSLHTAGKTDPLQRCMQSPPLAIQWQQPPAAALGCLQTCAMHAAGVWQQLSWSDRLLSLWIIGAMGLGLILGKFTGALPGPLACKRLSAPEPGACEQHYTLQRMFVCTVHDLSGLRQLAKHEVSLSMLHMHHDIWAGVFCRHEREVGYSEGGHSFAAHRTGAVAHDVAGAHKGTQHCMIALEYRLSSEHFSLFSCEQKVASSRHEPAATSAPAQVRYEVLGKLLRERGMLKQVCCLLPGQCSCHSLHAGMFATQSAET
jgi:hypothetical protein